MHAHAAPVLPPAIGFPTPRYASIGGYSGLRRPNLLTQVFQKNERERHVVQHPVFCLLPLLALPQLFLSHWVSHDGCSRLLPMSLSLLLLGE